MDPRSIPSISINMPPSAPVSRSGGFLGIMKKPYVAIFLGAAAISAASYVFIKRQAAADEVGAEAPVPVAESAMIEEAPAQSSVTAAPASVPSSGGVPTFEAAAGGLGAVTLGQMQAPAPLQDGSVQLQGIGLAAQTLYKPAGHFDTGIHTAFTGRASGADFKPPVMGSTGWTDLAIGLHTNRGQSRDLRGSVHVPISENEMPEGASIPNFGPMVFADKSSSTIRNVNEMWPEGVPPPPITGFHSAGTDQAPPIMPPAVV